jgi:outer membrane protein TolC
VPGRRDRREGPGGREVVTKPVALALPGALAAALLASLPGCSAAAQRARADAEAQAALEARRPVVPEVSGSLDVDAADAAALPARSLGDLTLDLPSTLRLAATASREYRARREEAYLAALAFAEARKDYRGRLRVGGHAEAFVDGGDAGVGGGPAAGLERAFATGGGLVLDLVTTFLHALRGDPFAAVSSLVSGELVLPLARGSGPSAREALTQAERDVVYALRSYARFQQEFAVRVAAAYWRAVLRADVLATEEGNHGHLGTLLARARAFGAEGAGRLPDFQVDEARQDLLRADERRTRAAKDLERALDDLKRLLGVPPTARLALVPGALERLLEGPASLPPGDERDAVARAHALRLDLRNARDRHDDARRRVAVAAEGLLPQVDLVLRGAGEGSSRRPFDLDGARGLASAGVALDLPVDRHAERTALRAAEVHAMAARRDVEALADEVAAEVREARRALEEAVRSRAIQEEGVRVASRRVESAGLSLRAGRAATRDVLEAQEDRNDARIALATAVVDHELARLALLRDEGTLDPGVLLAGPVVRVAAASDLPDPRPARESTRAPAGAAR